MARPRLLVVASTFPRSSQDGTPAFVRDLAIREAASFDTLVLVPRVPGAPRREAGDGIHVERFAYFPRRWEDLADGAILDNLRARRSRWLQVVPFFVAQVVAMRRAVQRHRPDVVHVHWLVPQGVSALLAARRVPKLLTTLGGDLYALHDPIARLLKRRVVRSATAITAMSDDMRRRLLDLGADPATTTILPMGADATTIRAGARGVARDDGRVLFVGRLVEKKGVPVLLRALDRLVQQAPRPSWRLVIVGDGPLRAELETAARGRAYDVEFVGTLSRRDLAREYARAAVVVFPSIAAASGDQDGLPVALLEAMVCGAPVVASRLPGIDTAVVDGESGILVEPGDELMLAAALDRLLSDGEERSRLGTSAAARSADFTVDAIGERYCRLLLEIAGRRSETQG